MAKGRKTGGRQPGSPNKFTRELRDMILQALDESGGVAYLVRQANESPGHFLTLVGKVLPYVVTGPGDGPVTHKITVEYVDPRANS